MPTELIPYIETSQCKLAKLHQPVLDVLSRNFALWETALSIQTVESGC